MKQFTPQLRQSARCLKRNQIPQVFAAFWVVRVAGWLLLLAAVGCTSVHNVRTVRPSADVDREPFTVLTYNIRVGHGSKNPGVGPRELRRSKKNLAPIIEAIASVDPDVVGLQEVLGSGQAQSIAEGLDLNFTYAAHAGSGWWGLAILSKFPIDNCNSRGVSGGRSILICAIEIGDKQVNFVNVHKNLQRTRSSVTSIMAEVNRINPPLIVMGDFNVASRDPRITIVKAKLLDTADQVSTASSSHAWARGTWAAGSGYRIDYVFVDDRNFQVEDVGLIPNQHVKASDHIGYWARLSLGKETGSGDKSKSGGIRDPTRP